MLETSYDPTRPVRPFLPVGSRQNQRQRRSQILATIRQLLIEDGLDGVTVRRIAASSNHAVQTIYNLVGPRDQAIIEAISDYTRYVGRTAKADPANPDAVSRLIQCWLHSITAAPAFCRQVSLIYFTDKRGIFYKFRDRQAQGMAGLLSRQQRIGVLRADANVREIAEQMVLLASALCIEWADRPFPIEELHRRLGAGYANLLAGAFASGGRALPGPSLGMLPQTHIVGASTNYVGLGDHP